MSKHRFRRISLIAAGCTAATVALAPGTASATGATYAPTVYPAAHVSPDGTSDLDGDGRADLVIDYRFSTAQGWENYWMFRRGTDGRALWSLHQRNAWYADVAWPMRVGSPVRAGIVNVHSFQYKDSSQNAGAGITAYDGATGRQLWRLRPVLGRTVPAFLRGPADQPAWIVVRDADGPLSVITAADGSVVSRLGPSSVAARRVARITSVSGVADADGDHVGDVLVTTSSKNTRGVYASAWDLVSGRYGTLLWDARYSFVDVHHGYPVTTLDAVGDIDGDGGSEFLLTHAYGFHDSIADVAVRSGRTGAVLWKRHIDNSGSANYAGAQVFGDVNADGVDDVLLSGQDPPHPVVPALVNGRNGAVLRQADGASPLFASVDNTGDDEVGLSYAAPADTTTLTVRDGLTGQAYYTHVFGGPLDSPQNSVDLTGEGRADILVETPPAYADSVNGRTRITALRGASGAVLWSITAYGPGG